MAQEIINTGTTANDGTGDPLRTAFIKTDNNFDQIWAAGPVGTNVQISGNTISTVQVNQDLVLAPNGVANVRINNNTVPNANNIWYLGSVTNQWRGLYVGNVVAGNISISNGLVVPGDASIGGNLTVEGDVIQIGNIVTDSKTLQLANTASTDAAADGSGVTVGSNDDIATLLYNSTNNEWRTNIGANVAGNVTANYFIGDGSQLTGLPAQYGNANVAAYLPTYTGNLSGNSATLTNTLILGNLELYSDAAGATDALIKTTGGSGADILIEASGNLYLTPDGGEVLITKQTASTDENTGALLVYGGIGVNGNLNAGGNISAAGWTGNLIPSANAVYSLGNSTNYWSNLWVANNTIYIGGVPLGITAGNVLTVAGEPILSNDSNTSITTTGNITADYFFGNGSQLTGLSTNSISNGNSNVEIATANGNVTVTTAGTETWRFDTNGDLTVPNYINFKGNTYIGDEPGSGSPAFRIVAPLTYGATIETDSDISGNSWTWTFGADGVLGAPGNITANSFIGDGSQLTGLPDGTAIVNGTSQIDIPTANGNIYVGVNNVGSTEFTALGINTLTLAALANITAAGTITATSDISGGNIATTGNVDANYINVTHDILADYIEATGNITATGNISANYFVGNGSALTGLTYNQTGNIVGDQANVTLVAGSYNTVFDDTGNVTLPGNLIFADSSKFASASWTLIESPPPIDFNSGSTQMVQLGNTPATLIANYNELYIRLQGPDASDWRTSTIVPTPDVGPNSTISLGTIPYTNTGDSKIIFDVLANANVRIQMSVNSGRYGNLVIYGR